MIAQANAATGKQVSLDPTAPPSRADQVRALGKSSVAISGGSVLDAADGAEKANEIATTSPEGLLGGRLKTDFNTRTNAAADDQLEASQGKQHEASAALQTLGEGAGMAGDVVTETAKSGLNALDAALPKPMGDVKQPGQELPGILDTPSGKALAASIAQFQKDHPEASKNLGAIFNLGTLIPGEGLAADAAEGGVKAGLSAADKAASGVKDFSQAVDASAPAAGEGLVEKAKLAATKGNQIPTLENAAKDGIAVPGETAIKDPLATYDEHIATEQAAAKDAKADTALGTVGSRIGDAFRKVVGIRQDAGKTMASELEKFGNKGVDVSDATQNFEKELEGSGAHVDAETGELITKGQTKLSSTDKGLLQKYSEELHGLGPNPTAKDLDAFIGRLPKEIKALKSSAGVTFKTDAERIIGNHLNDLRNTLAGASTPAYKAARAQYANLSNFVKEGSGFLGKMTQSGDFAKDASLAKSSVQSMLNNGKKDWLVKLEEHSGYPAMHDAVLALQAMKDTGDYRGASLLESLTNGAAKGELPKVPTGLTGIANHFLGKGLKLGTEKFVGTPIEQTRRFLQSLQKAKKP